MAFEHSPVLLEQVIAELRLSGPEEKEKREKRIVDCTLGLGGYSEAILTTCPEAVVYALDRDRAAIEAARTRLLEYGDRFRAFHANFGDMEEVLGEFSPLDAFVFDLGVSNMQLTEADRGFSFQHNGPLDMRMNPDGAAQSAADVLSGLSAAELEEIFRTYGEERHAKRIATKIEESRKRGRVPATTEELVALIRETLPAPVQRKMGTHPARRVFQALRIYVNDELGELKSGLKGVKTLANTKATVVVVSYHSLEDRIVKHTFRTWDREEKKGAVLTKHPLVPDSEETGRNFRARSAKLRTFRFF
ncbi:MAG: 16S rRNA (cytosine(1402)-N(4))-methyltransferase RsmH [Synergistaceae bacterium]|jgi:16S rRNA (cytosine1402-N4)-methyltransferase|nr:16S rRNA (cytosine(1402)-N(4))-methyltransferase RsmH [Synergistaceae bacterium]